jgi:alpha-L-fucosidase
MLKLCNSRQANYLLNVPPDRTGRIPEWLVRRLGEIGQKWQTAQLAKPDPK